MTRRRRRTVSLLATLAAGLLLPTGAAGQDDGGATPEPEGPVSRPGVLPRPELLGPLEPMPILDIGGGRPLTAEDVRRSVDRHHPTLAAVRERARGAQGDLLAAEGGFDLFFRATSGIYPVGFYDWGQVNVSLEQPTPFWGATVYGGWRLGRGNEIQWYNAGYETLGGGEFRLGLRVPLWQDGPIDARRAGLWRARQALEAAERTVDATALQLRVAGASAYWTWVAAGRRYQIAAQLLTLATDRDGQIRSRAVGGAIPGLEVLENRRVVLTRQRALVAARRSLERASIALSLYYRDAGGDPVVAGAERVPTDREDLPQVAVTEADAIRLALRQRPEVARFEALRERSEIQVRYAENRFAPRVDVGVEVSRDIGDYSSSQAIFTTSGIDRPQNFGTQSTLEPTVLYTSISLTFPVQFRTARGQAERARADLDALEEEGRLLRDGITVAVRDALSAFRAAEEGVGIARRSTEVAWAVAEAERRRFDLGQSQLFIVNLREQAAAAAQADQVNAEAEVQVAFARYRAVLGDL